jgi:hypothetical protein
VLGRRHFTVILPDQPELERVMGIIFLCTMSVQTLLKGT